MRTEAATARATDDVAARRKRLETKVLRGESWRDALALSVGFGLEELAQAIFSATFEGLSRAANAGARAGVAGVVSAGIVLAHASPWSSRVTT